MVELEGLLHDGSTSRSRPASLTVYPDGSVRWKSEGHEQASTFDALRIPARLGRTPRRIALPDGSEFETHDNDAVDDLLAAHGRARDGWLHWLESRVAIVAFATIVVLIAGAVFAVRGIPAIAREAAFAIPPELDARLGEGTLDVLDQSFSTSELAEARRSELEQAFSRVVDAAPAGHQLTLRFRRGELLGANAFALPDGTVVMTDELVALAEHDEELVAVLAHEVGHVVHRHGLREAIQSSLVALAIILVSGDLSSTTGFVAALPTILAESSFSRDFEREADDYALDYLALRGIPPQRFADLLERLEAAGGESALDVTFLSSHPSTDERVARLRGASGS